MTQDGRKALHNRLLLALPEETLERLRPHLRSVRLRKGQWIDRVDQPVQDFYFVDRGFISMVKTMSDGRAVEVGGVGVEGVTAPNALLGVGRSVFDTMVQVSGEGFRIRRDVLRQEMQSAPALAELIKNYARFLLGQIGQTAACNRLHSVEERCCRWLLIAEDNSLSNRFVLTHEFLAMMLGSQRSGVSIAMRALRRAGLVEYDRGLVQVLDRAGLEEAACECYRSTQQEIELLFDGQDCEAHMKSSRIARD